MKRTAPYGIQSRHPWWWTFSDVELSMIASHLAVGGAFCCEHNEDARLAVTSDKRKLELLEDHAYQGWGCWYHKSGHAGAGPYLRANGCPWDEKFFSYLRANDLMRASRFFKEFLEEISP